MTKGKTLTGPALIAGAILAAGLIVGWMARPQSEYDRQMQYMHDLRQGVMQAVHQNLEKLPAYRACEQQLTTDKDLQQLTAKMGRDFALQACLSARDRALSE